MTKSFKDLREATGSIVKNYIGPAELRDVKLTCRQLSAAFQPSIDEVLAKIESKLAFFGYTLGELDNEAGWDDVGEEDFFILTNVDSEVVRNAYITVAWDKLASGQQAPMGKVPSALRFDVAVEVNEVSPAEIQGMIDDALTGGEEQDFFAPDEDSEDEENIQEGVIDEAFRIKSVNRTLTVQDAEGGTLTVNAKNDGSLSLSGSVHVQKIKSEDVIEAINNHFVKYHGDEVKESLKEGADYHSASEHHGSISDLHNELAGHHAKLHDLHKAAGNKALSKHHLKQMAHHDTESENTRTYIIA